MDRTDTKVKTSMRNFLLACCGCCGNSFGSSVFLYGQTYPPNHHYLDGYGHIDNLITSA